MWGDRSGREPARARSPLRMRRMYGLAGAALCIVGMGVLLVTGGGGWWMGTLAALALIGVTDAVVMTRRIAGQRRE